MNVINPEFQPRLRYNSINLETTAMGVVNRW